MRDILNFKGMFNGTIDMPESEMKCVPSKEKYGYVHIGFHDGMIYTVLDVACDSLSFEEKKKLGYEVERRWNNWKKLKDLMQLAIDNYDGSEELQMMVDTYKKTLEVMEDLELPKGGDHAWL